MFTKTMKYFCAVTFKRYTVVRPQNQTRSKVWYDTIYISTLLVSVKIYLPLLDYIMKNKMCESQHMLPLNFNFFLFFAI